MSTAQLSPPTNSASFHLKSVSEFCEARFSHRHRIESQGLMPFEMIQCAEDVTYWAETWVWTFDPRRKPAYIPLIPWLKQIEFLQWLDDREAKEESGLVEKSRDSGISVLCCARSVHRWLFHEGYSTGFGSRKEVYIDNQGDPDSLFEKLRIIIDCLPAWMKPNGYNPKQHATFCKIVNPQNGNTITGEAGDNIGRGGRKSMYFVDEAAFIERAHLIDRSLVANTECRIDVSTPNGVGNSFYERRFSGTVPVFTFGYEDDPRKTPEWCAKKRKTIGELRWAQEYGIDYAASVEGVCIPAAWVRAAVNLQETMQWTLVTPRAGYDIAEEGDDNNVFIDGSGPVVLNIEAWNGCTTTQSAYRAIEIAKKRATGTVNYDSVGVGTGPKGIWKAMPDDAKRLWENGPVIDLVPINTGEAPTTARWPDGRTSGEIFDNLKAEAWWTLRTRFERTYEHVNGIKTHPHDELISIPNHPQLIAELSVPKVEYTDKGKIKIESKRQLRARGVKSPDFAEALVLMFCPRNPKRGIWVGRPES